jgi:ribosomal protein S18 acetylase RimI-like enzyme
MSSFQKYLDDLRTLPADALLGYRHEGMRGIWKSVAARSVHRLVRVGHLIVFAHSVDGVVEPSLPPGIRIALASDQDWSALAAVAGEREVSRFRTLLARGRRCLIAWRDQTPVGYAWLADQIGPDVVVWPLPLEFPASAAYLWNLYVLPTERSNGIGSALARARLRLAKEKGFREGWRMVSPSNEPSLRTVRKSASGTRVVGEIRFVQLLGRSYARFIPHPAGTAELS